MTLLPRPCLDCGRVTHGSRCPACASKHERNRGNSTARGYGTNWRAKSERITRQVGRCERCGVTHTADNPLTLDHVVPKSRGGTAEQVQVLCRKCNSHKGANAA